MCTNGRFIYNRYSGQNVFVRCGHCDACKQENAMKRTNRIRLHQRNGYICLFVTLTYTNDFVPYVKKSDLMSDSLDINVYRRCTGRFVFSNQNGLQFKKCNEIDLVSSYFVPFDLRNDSSVYCLKHLNGLGNDYVGICYYPDLQNFLKRFRLNYEREYKERLQFDYFAVSEFGGFSYRPHFHLLLFIPAAFETKVRTCILKSWPFADSRRTAKFIEVARDAASYVASYVNGNVHNAALLSYDAFKQKHSQSKNLGITLDVFSLPQILAKIDKRDLHVYREQQFDGKSCVASLLIPQYIINRYFPKFKGMRWFTTDALRNLLVSPSKIWEMIGDYDDIYYIRNVVKFNDDVNDDRYKITDYTVVGSRSTVRFPPLYSFSRSEVYQIGIRLMNAQLRFMEVTGLNAYDFAYYYETCWNLYNSTLLIDSHDESDGLIDYNEFYFNNNDLINDVVHSESLCLDELQPNPNLFHDLVIKSANLSHTYFLKDKTKKVVNYAMANLGYDV